jgi:catechol 2,3-dioxygenase-like lactoylglutathione lyase family enzyme
VHGGQRRGEQRAAAPDVHLLPILSRASDSFKTRARRRAYGGGMAVQFEVIGLVVADLEASLAFYRQLGLDIPADHDPNHVEAALPGGLRIAWDPVDTIRSFDPEWTAPRGSHRVALAFRCDSPDEVDRVYADLVKAGSESHKEPWDAFWGMRYAVVLDPDGNSVDLFAQLAERSG